MSTAPNPLYGGLTGAEFRFETFQLPHGVVVAQTYAHLMAHFILAFERAVPGKPNPAPWKSANAGLTFDIEAEIHVPEHFDIPEWFDRVNTIWWTAALIRMRVSPLVRVPIISSMAFKEIARLEREPVVRIMEVQAGHLFGRDAKAAAVEKADLDWISQFWLSGGKLFCQHTNFANAVVGFDQSVWSVSHGLGLVQLWGAFELLFATSRHRKTFQLSSRISAFLEPPGDSRVAVAKEVVSLYESRSDAAHGNPSGQEDAFFQSHALLKRALVKMIEDDFVPSVADLEHLSHAGAVIGVQ